MSQFEDLLAGTQEPLRSILDRFLSTLGGSTDLTLAVLRGHLLLEELLWRGILSAVPYPDQIEGARLNFGRLSALFKALHGDGGASQQVTWAFLNRLNALRNSLAHRIDVPQLEREVDALVELSAASTDRRIVAGQERVYLFTLAVGYVAGRLASVLPPEGSPRDSP